MWIKVSEGLFINLHWTKKIELNVVDEGSESTADESATSAAIFFADGGELYLYGDRQQAAIAAAIEKYASDWTHVFDRTHNGEDSAASVVRPDSYIEYRPHAPPSDEEATDRGA